MNKGILTASKFNQTKYGKTLKKERSKFLKTSGQKALEKAAPAAGDYNGSRIADKITSRRPQKIEEESEETIIPPDK